MADNAAIADAAQVLAGELYRLDPKATPKA